MSCETDTLSTVCVTLFVPSSRPDRFPKAAASGADALIVDLEDAVPEADKDAARCNLTALSTALPVMVRINAIGTPWYASDIEAVLQQRPAAVMVPKAKRTKDFDILLTRLAPTPVIALIETARGLAEARAIAGLPGVLRLAFGSLDFCVDLDCAHDPDILLPARSELVLASRLAGLAAPLDGVTAQIGAPELVTEDAARARRIGMGGKLAIHPDQIVPIRAAFAPDPAQIAWARRILTGGDGAETLDGAMVDAPVRDRARQILARADTLQQRK